MFFLTEESGMSDSFFKGRHNPRRNVGRFCDDSRLTTQLSVNAIEREIHAYVRTVSPR